MKDTSLVTYNSTPLHDGKMCITDYHSVTRLAAISDELRKILESMVGYTVSSIECTRSTLAIELTKSDDNGSTVHRTFSLEF